MSTKVLLVADGAWATGFERVARAIGSALQATPGLEVVQRGIGYDGKAITRVAPYPYEIKSTGQTASDPLGVTQMPRWLKEDRPDVVVMVQDIWVQVNYLGYVDRETPTVGYYPIDTPNLKWSYAMGAAALTDAVPYTQFGARETAIGMRDAVDVITQAYAHDEATSTGKATWLSLPKDGMNLHFRADRFAERQNVDAYRPVLHGVDRDLFRPLDRAACRKHWNIPADAFVVMNVNTNQFRKRQDLCIRAFAEFAATCPRALLVLHCMGGGGREGWDLPQLARLYGVQDKVILPHLERPTLADDDLVQLYNCADVQLNTGGGEGFGLTSAEGALCGIPQGVPDWSATREIWDGSGVLLPVSDYRMEAKYLNTAHAILDPHQIAQHLAYFEARPEVATAIGQACRERALELPTWDSVGAEFVTRVQRALQPSTPEPMSLSDIAERRRGALQSELLQFPLRPISGSAIG